MRIRFLPRQPYLDTVEAMQAFTNSRGAETPDEIWICEHEPVFTLGLASRPEHLLAPGSIEVVATNRGGQVTYHGPGQVVAYPLIDLKRAGYFVKEYVYRVEEALIRTLASYLVTGHRVAGAPGIYVKLDDPFGHSMLAQRPKHINPADHPDPNQPRSIDFTGLGKIGALGIKVSRHCTYHGLSLNISMDLEPFTRINPCGYPGLPTIDLASLGIQADWREAADRLADQLIRRLA
jgi:lipoyl(octanoyl) transferase